jgi:CRP-like cAMP-binding protein
MAVVLEGEVVATVGDGDAIVARFGPGSVVTTVGTLGAIAFARFTATSDDTMIALWDGASLRTALASDPVASSALHAVADRLQAWASLTTSAMGVALHEEVRLRLFERLDVRSLPAGQELLAANEVVGGMFIVGAGAIVVDGATTGPLEPGSFVFAGATLSAGRATASARASDHGAIVLCADRRTTQELYATEPLLLELLAASS